MPRNRNTKNKNVRKNIVVIPKYSDILKKANSKEESVTNDVCTDESASVDIKSIKFSRRPPSYLSEKNVCYDTWEKSYFLQLIALRDIFCKDYTEFFSNEETITHLQSPKFFHDFAKMIFDSSSKLIQADLEPLSEEMEDVYSEYLIKRNNL